ncbi:MAG: AraC family transcriptional regulator [Haliscomenobacteraceae bacterium CHB4]|nr:AraC family transcriptional regulator [Haliscomenobacteraceae bacterium CHB4]
MEYLKRQQSGTLGSQSYFSRLFLKTFGTTPSEYRKNAGTPADE